VIHVEEFCAQGGHAHQEQRNFADNHPTAHARHSFVHRGTTPADSDLALASAAADWLTLGESARSTLQDDKFGGL
jgi:hypothetical protein